MTTDFATDVELVREWFYHQPFGQSVQCWSLAQHIGLTPQETKLVCSYLERQGELWRHHRSGWYRMRLNHWLSAKSMRIADEVKMELDWYIDRTKDREAASRRIQVPRDRLLTFLRVHHHAVHVRTYPTSDEMLRGPILYRGYELIAKEP